MSVGTGGAGSREVERRPYLIPGLQGRRRAGVEIASGDRFETCPPVDTIKRHFSDGIVGKLVEQQNGHQSDSPTCFARSSSTSMTRRHGEFARSGPRLTMLECAHSRRCQSRSTSRTSHLPYSRPLIRSRSLGSSPKRVEERLGLTTVAVCVRRAHSSGIRWCSAGDTPFRHPNTTELTASM